MTTKITASDLNIIIDLGYATHQEDLSRRLKDYASELKIKRDNILNGILKYKKRDIKLEMKTSKTTKCTTLKYTEDFIENLISGNIVEDLGNGDKEISQVCYCNICKYVFHYCNTCNVVVRHLVNINKNSNLLAEKIYNNSK